MSRKRAPYEGGPWQLGGLASRRWSERRKRADWPEELARLIAYARQHSNTTIGAAYLEALLAEQRALALLTEPTTTSASRGE